MYSCKETDVISNEQRHLEAPNTISRCSFQTISGHSLFAWQRVCSCGDEWEGRGCLSTKRERFLLKEVLAADMKLLPLSGHIHISILKEANRLYWTFVSSFDSQN